jgi:hypothetical protein
VRLDGLAAIVEPDFTRSYYLAGPWADIAASVSKMETRKIDAAFLLPPNRKNEKPLKFTMSW